MKDINALNDFTNFLMDCHQARQVKIWNVGLNMFYVTMSRPVDDKSYEKGWVSLHIRYEMQKFSAYACITEKPLPVYREIMAALIEIPQKFADEIKKNESFKKTLLARLTDFAKESGKSNASFGKVFEVLEQKGVSVQRNNSIAKISAENALRKAKEEENKNALKAAAKKYGSNQEWSYYKEYYRGPNSPAHDDDYEGSGDLSFEEVVLSLCRSEEQVKKLASQPVGFSIVTTSDHYRTYYSRAK